MDILFKICGLLLVSCCGALLIRKSNPELSVQLSLASVTVVLAAALPLLRPLRDQWEKANALYGVGDVYTLPLIKCCAASVVAKLTADLCREASQNAAASASEILGVLCALSAAMPLVGNMLSVIGEML